MNIMKQVRVNYMYEATIDPERAVDGEKMLRAAINATNFHLDVIEAYMTSGKDGKADFSGGMTVTRVGESAGCRVITDNYQNGAFPNMQLAIDEILRKGFKYYTLFDRVRSIQINLCSTKDIFTVVMPDIMNSTNFMKNVAQELVTLADDTPQNKASGIGNDRRPKDYSGRYY